LLAIWGCFKLFFEIDSLLVTRIIIRRSTSISYLKPLLKEVLNIFH
jgi:hypothetical protein